MRFGQVAMRIIKYLLLTIVIFVILTPVGIYFYIKQTPSLDSNQAILILGKGGEGHTAPNLTDTIMVAFLNSESKKITFLSLPRDIWIPEIRAKLNTAYHYGGFKMASDSVKSITNVPINNTIVVDFSLFKDVIDAIGGITIDVENSFTDERYPITGKENDLCGGDRTYACRYETLVFDTGLTKMDGETALKFVRSRNAKGDEGTDLAREKRQQKVISAIQNKMLSGEVLFNISVLKKMYDVISSHIETDIKLDSLQNKTTIVTLFKFILESKNNINFISIPENLIEVSQNNKKYDLQYVFIPSSGNWFTFQKILKDRI